MKLFRTLCIIAIILVCVGCAFAAEEGESGRTLAAELMYEAELDDDVRTQMTIYQRVVNECGDTLEAQKALWNISQLYLDGFDCPMTAEAITALEQFLVRFPKSEWTQHVELSLAELYKSAKNWVKEAQMLEKCLTNMDMPISVWNSLAERCVEIYRAQGDNDKVKKLKTKMKTRAE